MDHHPEVQEALTNFSSKQAKMVERSIWIRILILVIIVAMIGSILMTTIVVKTLDKNSAVQAQTVMVLATLNKNISKLDVDIKNNYLSLRQENADLHIENADLQTIISDLTKILSTQPPPPKKK